MIYKAQDDPWEERWLQASLDTLQFFFCSPSTRMLSNQPVTSPKVFSANIGAMTRSYNFIPGTSTPARSEAIPSGNTPQDINKKTVCRTNTDQFRTTLVTPGQLGVSHSTLELCLTFMTRLLWELAVWMAARFAAKAGWSWDGLWCVAHLHTLNNKQASVNCWKEY